MADPMLPVQNDVGALVLQATEEDWVKIKKALKAETREQAAGFVQADDKARKIVLDILGGNTMVTKPATKRAESFTSANSTPRTPLSEQLYGSKKAKVEF